MKDRHGNPVPLRKLIDVPPAWLLGTLVLQVALHRLIPVGVFDSAPTRFLGIGLVIAAIALVGWSARTFSRAHTPIHPRRKPSTLLTGGPFALSRNPIYLAMAMVSLGAALWLGSLLPLLGPPLFMLVVRKRFIEGEEFHIARHFGEEWHAYARRVRRWL